MNGKAHYKIRRKPRISAGAGFLSVKIGWRVSAIVANMRRKTSRIVSNRCPI